MELKEAIQIIKDIDVLDDAELEEARGTVLQALEELQKENELARKSLIENSNIADERNDLLVEVQKLKKENEKLKEIDLTTVYIKGVCDEKERWRNKIKEEMKKVDEEAFGKPYDVDTADGYHSQAMGMWCMCNKLLKGE